MRLVSVDPDQTMPLSLKLFSRATGETRFVGAHVLDDERVTIGRSKECTLNLHDPERRLSPVQAGVVAQVKRCNNGWRTTALPVRVQPDRSAARAGVCSNSCRDRPPKMRLPKRLALPLEKIRDRP